jgi:serine/threonine protein kinase
MTPDRDAIDTAPPNLTRSGVGGATPDDETRPTAGGAAMSDGPAGFVIIREVGRGGMGVVYLARQHGLNRPVALKVMAAGDVGSALRFSWPNARRWPRCGTQT